MFFTSRSLSLAHRRGANLNFACVHFFAMPPKPKALVVDGLEATLERKTYTVGKRVGSGGFGAIYEGW